MTPLLPDGYSWSNSVFGTHNFPKQDGYINSGTRTNYIPTSEFNYPFMGGFKPKENSKIFLNDSTKPISEPVFFTIDAKLYRGSELEIGSKNSIFSTVTVDGLKYEPDGYMLISSIHKPTPTLSSRITNGSTTQKTVGEYFKSLNPNVEYSTNIIGSPKTDVVLNINNKILNVEVKSSSNGLKSIHTFFDKSTKRGKPIHRYVENIAKGYCKFFSIEKSSSYFESLIDYFRSDDESIGLAGDLGVAKSGKLPRVLLTTDEEILQDMFSTIIEHFVENGDHYFAIVDRNSNKVHAYFVGENDEDNVFNLPNLLKLVYGGLTTYGGVSSGCTRIAFKAKFYDYE